jgi:hypothetical protein
MSIAEVESDVASHARIPCKWCGFRHLRPQTILLTDLLPEAAENGGHDEVNDFRKR